MVNTTREKAIKLHSEIVLDIKQTKSKFCKIIKTINKDVELRSLFTPEMSIHLTHLIELWKNNRDANMECYFTTFKEHHSHINGNKIHNVNLKNMWDDYISSCSDFRCKMLMLNNLCSELKEFEM